MIAIGMVAVLVGWQGAKPVTEILGVADILPDRVIAWGLNGVRKPALEQELAGYMKYRSLRFTFQKKNRYLIVSLDPVYGVDTDIRSEPNFDMLGDNLVHDEKRRIDWYHLDAEQDSKTVDITIKTRVPSGEYLTVDFEDQTKVRIGPDEYVFGTCEKDPQYRNSDMWVSTAKGPTPTLAWTFYGGDAFDRANAPIKSGSAQMSYDPNKKFLEIRTTHDPRQLSMLKFMREDVYVKQYLKYPLDPRS